MFGVKLEKIFALVVFVIYGHMLLSLYFCLTIDGYSLGITTHIQLISKIVVPEKSSLQGV